MLAELLRYLEYPFVRYAIVAAMLISLCSALVGVILVLKRYSYIGDGLSHVAFGAMSIALVLGMIQQKMYLVFPITTVAAILILKSGGPCSQSSQDGGEPRNGFYRCTRTWLSLDESISTDCQYQWRCM